MTLNLFGPYVRAYLSQALMLSHPHKLIRDTARFPPLMRPSAPGRKAKSRALRHLAREHLGLTIQEGEHTPIDDARATLYLYHKYRKVRDSCSSVTQYPH